MKRTPTYPEEAPEISIQPTAAPEEAQEDQGERPDLTTEDISTLQVKVEEEVTFGLQKMASGLKLMSAYRHKRILGWPCVSNYILSSRKQSRFCWLKKLCDKKTHELSSRLLKRR